MPSAQPSPAPAAFYQFVIEGDDHEREVFTAPDERTALQHAAAHWHDRYYDPEEGDLAQYGPDDFDVVAVYPDGADVDPFVGLPPGRLAQWPSGNPGPHQHDPLDPLL